MPPFIFLISREASEKYHISREIGLKTHTPFSGFARENLPETNGQKAHFPEKMGTRMLPLVHLREGGLMISHLVI